MKKIICCFLACAFMISVAMGLVACGTDYSEDAVVIYVEYNGLIGKGDEEVEVALEEKFLADTGESIDLIVEANSTSTIGQKVTGALGADSDRIDAIITHYSSDSLITQMIGNEQEVKNITDAVQTYAPAYLAALNDESDPNKFVYRKSLYNGRIFAMSSLEPASIFGMMVNRNYMANTSFNPDEYDIANEGYKSLTISEFTQLLRELDENNPEIGRPLGGAPYDLEYFIAPVFENAGYIHMDKVDGVVYPAYATESYLDVLEYERMLQVEKLWNENPTNSPNAERDFLAGKSAIYISYPEVTQQINKARDLKKSMGHDCIMLAPLRPDGSEESNGNARHETAFLGMIVPKKGQNTELLLKFINWMYADVENYELAKYGIEGEHWVKAEVDGQPAYAYPDEKKEEYEETAPYNGLYCFLPNVFISNRIYAGYNEQEAKWVEEVHNFKTYPANGYVEEGMNLPAVPRSNRDLVRQEAAFGLEYTNIRKYAWSDAALPDGETLASMHQAMMQNVATTYADYIAYINEEYNKIIESYQ